MDRRHQPPDVSPTFLTGAATALRREAVAGREERVHREVVIKDGEFVRPAPREQPEQAAAG